MKNEKDRGWCLVRFALSLKGKLVKIQHGPATVNDCCSCNDATVNIWEGARKQ